MLLSQSAMVAVSTALAAPFPFMPVIAAVAGAPSMTPASTVPVVAADAPNPAPVTPETDGALDEIARLADDLMPIAASS